MRVYKDQNKDGTILDKERNEVGMKQFSTKNTKNRKESNGPSSTKNTKNGRERNMDGRIGKGRTRTERSIAEGPRSRK